MVFESVVATVLNKLLGSYVENLDASQLNLGIWGGNVVLNNLNLTDTALDDMDLPVKLKSGFLEKLSLRIPWTNLYTEPVVAEVQGLYVLAVPNAGIQYNAEKEEKTMLEAKKAELRRIEAAKEKPALQQTAEQDTFVEKMTAQVIKNLQVIIRDIHIRYEDRFSNRDRPFALGVTLHELCFQTTDDNWKPCVVKELTKFIYKIAEMKSLAVYWNFNCKLITDLGDRESIKKALKSSIAHDDYVPPDFHYILMPITIGAYLKLNPKPEIDGTNFKTPKIHLSITVDKLCLNVEKFQYEGILEFLEAQEQFALNAKYRKFRPFMLPYRNHMKEWWHFAINCILETQVRRVAKNWSWSHIKAHRQLVKRYEIAWIDKRTVKNISREKLAIIDQAEKQLDVFNLIIARQQAELQVKRRGLKLVEEQGGWMSWATGWWGGRSDEKKVSGDTANDIAAEFEKAMTKEEKEKLYEAIDYQENQLSTQYPPEFVENVVQFKMIGFLVCVHDNAPDGQRQLALRMGLQTVESTLEMRPSAAAIKFESKIGMFDIKGSNEKTSDAVVPIVSCELGKQSANDFAQVVVSFETNPLDHSCDQRLSLRAQPLVITYHAYSINRLVCVLRPPESVRLKKLTDAAMLKYEDIKSKSPTALQHALMYRKGMKVDLEILPTVLRIPDYGDLDKAESLIILDFGNLSIKSIASPGLSLTDDFAHKMEEEKLSELVVKAYDTLNVELKSLNIAFVERTRHGTFDLNFATALLEPTGFKIVLQTAIIDDLKLPKTRVCGTLPDLSFNISDIYLLKVLKLLLSIPTPPPQPTGKFDIELEVEEARKRPRVVLQRASDISLIEEVDETDANAEKQVEPRDIKFNQQIQLELKFVLSQICLNVIRGAKESGQYVRFRLLSLGMELQMRALDMRANAYMGTIELCHYHYKDFHSQSSPLYIMKKGGDEVGRHLLSVEYVQVDRSNPFFQSNFESTEQNIRISAEPLVFNVHQEALVDVQNFFMSLQAAIASSNRQRVEAEVQESQTLPRAASSSSLCSLRSMRVASAKKGKKLKGVPEWYYMMKLVAKISGLRVTIGSAKGPISEASIEGFSAKMLQRKDETSTTVILKAVAIDYFDQDSHYKKILDVMGEEMFHLECIQYTRDVDQITLDSNQQVDMCLVVRFAKMRFIFLNIWLSRLLNWLSPFQAAAEKTASLAGSAIQERARNAAEALQKGDISRIKLDILVETPVVVLPACSKSTKALVANLGKLSIANEFAYLKRPDGVVVLDKMSLMLNNIKLSRVFLGKDSWTLGDERELLRPITFTIRIVRNLSFDFYQTEPRVAMEGRLPNIEVRLTSEDYSVLMAILSENLAEVEEAPRAPEPTAAGSETDIHTKGPNAKPAEDISRQKAVPAPEKPPPAKEAVEMNFIFALERASITLYRSTIETKLEISQSEAFALAKLELSSIQADAQMLTSGKMTANLSLVAFTLDDIRKGVTGIRRLLDKKNGHADSHVLSASYAKEPDLYQNVNAVLAPLFLCLSADFLLNLSEFMAGHPEPGAVPSRAQPAKANLAAVTPSNSTVQKTAEQPAAPKDSGELTVRLKVSGIEVALVENSCRPDDSEAMFLLFKASVLLKQSITRMSLESSIENLEMITGCYAEEKRSAGVVHILAPCTLSFVYTKTGDTEEGQMKMSQVNMCVSPATIRLLSSALSEVMRNKADEAVAPSDSSESLDDILAPKCIADEEFWFTKVETAVECVEDSESKAVPTVADNQQMSFVVEQITFCLEADCGRKKLPMIFMRSSLSGDASNWSTGLIVMSTVRCEIWYFNDNNNAWEPILEPMMEENEVYRPWEFNVMVRQNVEDPSEIGVEREILKPARTTISVMSPNTLELTVTKSLLELCEKLGKAFNAAATASEQFGVQNVEKLAAPYMLKNNIGVDLIVHSSADFELPERYGCRPVPHGLTVPLFCKSQHSDLSSVAVQKLPALILQIEVPAWNLVRNIDVSRAVRRAFPLPFRDQTGEQHSLIADISTHLGSKIIMLRAPLTFHNVLPYDIEVYFKRQETLQCGLMLTANGNEIAPPLTYICRPYAEFFIRIKDERCDVAVRGLNWESVRKASAPLLLECNFECGRIFYVQASVKKGKALVENSNQVNHFVFIYTMVFEPAFSILNVLACPLKISAKNMDEVTLESGHSKSMFFLHPSVAKINLQAVLENSYTYSIDLSAQLQEFNVLTFVAAEASVTYPELNFGLHKDSTRGTVQMTIYAPIWMVNKTNLSVYYREDYNNSPVFSHSSGKDNMLMMSLSKKTFFAKKSLKMKVGDSGWSSGFPVDSVGSSGRISCTDSQKKTYEFSVTPSISEFGFTKICTITPFYQLKNMGKHSIEVRQVDTSDWVRVKEKECVGFWPDNKKNLLCTVRIEGTEGESQAFLLTDTLETLCRLPNKHVGVYICCGISDSGVTLSFYDYEKGMIPAMVINHLSNVDTRFKQTGCTEEWRTVKAGYYVYYFLDSLTSQKSLTCTCENVDKAFDIPLTFDGFEEFLLPADKHAYCVSFLNGRQRTILFTEDLAVCTNARQIYELEEADSEMLVSFHGVGLSLVNDSIAKEVAYIALRSTGVIWEQMKKRFRAFPVADCRALETAYTKYLADAKSAKVQDKHSRFILHKMQIDFAEMKIIKPVPREIRRSFQSGFTLQYRSSQHDLQIHVKINSIQIDNQLPGCVFRTAFSPTPVPKSVAAESVPKPLIEFSYIVRNAEHSTIPYVQYCKLLVQEMSVKVDQGFLNALMAMFAATSVSQEDSEVKYKRDMQYVEQGLEAHTLTVAANEQKAFYSLLHLSPLKVHISYSQGGCLSDESPTSGMLHAEIFSLLLKGVGVTLTEIQDVVLKLAYFERHSVFLSRNTLISEATDHYVRQVIKQLYVLVLGLDVIGNPFGLIRDLSTGVEQFFYEPIQGAIEGPEEFAEGLVYGLRSLVGHTLGSTAGAVSRITGTLGKGIAALTMDTDYQKRRQEMMNKRPTNLTSGIAHGGTGAVMGVVDGITGVFVKPIEGAREEGAVGFAKGLGKGLIGVVTRPVSGVVDFASSSLEAVKKVADAADEVKRIRPSRYIGQEKIVRPYSAMDAEGGSILQELEKGKYISTDRYVTHAILTQSGNEALIATDRRVMHVSKNNIAGVYGIEWKIPYNLMDNDPVISGSSITVFSKTSKQSNALFAKKPSTGKIVHFMSQHSAEAFYRRLTQAYQASKYC
uniref:UBA domain-containing protein n=1 Tax=Trichuris muris TaxID=70415 RepID=A0A5S6QAI9_TRIMR